MDTRDLEQVQNRSNDHIFATFDPRADRTTLRSASCTCANRIIADIGVTVIGAAGTIRRDRVRW